MAERCRIPKRSAEAIEAERRASINAERQRLGLSRSEAARMLPGAEFLMGKRAKSQQTGERAEHFKTEQRSSTMAAARDAAAARHRQLLHGQERLQAAAARKEALIKREAERQAGQRTLAAECLRQEARSLAAVPKELQNMAMAALKVAEKATGIAMETTVAAEKTYQAAQDLATTAKELVPPSVGLIAGHVMAAGVKEVMEGAHAARAWAPVTAEFRATINDQKRGLAAMKNELHAAYMTVAVQKEANREEGEILE